MISNTSLANLCSKISSSLYKITTLVLNYLAIIMMSSYPNLNNRSLCVKYKVSMWLDKIIMISCRSPFLLKLRPDPKSDMTENLGIFCWVAYWVRTLIWTCRSFFWSWLDTRAYPTFTRCVDCLILSISNNRAYDYLVFETLLLVVRIDPIFLKCIWKLLVL